jgi:hypothetical protein
VRRVVVILLFGLVAAIGAYCWTYRAGTSSPRRWMQSEQPELAWLKEEFTLSDAEFKRVSELHAGYLPKCQEMCQRIGDENARLQKLIATASAMTPEIEDAIATAARLRGECQRNMLRHFYEVSQSMPPAQGRRYLEWVMDRTLALEDRPMGHSLHR